MIGGGKHRAVRCGVIEHTGPVVVRRGDRAAQRDGDLFAAKALGDLPRHTDVALMIELAGINVGVLGLDAEHVLGVLLVGDAHIDIGQELRHAFAGLLARPELLAVVEVAGDRQSLFLCGLAGSQTGLRHFAAERGRDAGPVEPVRAVKDLIPIKLRSRGRGNGGACAVINDLARTLGSALLTVVNTKARAAAQHQRGVHTVAAQLVDGALTNLVRGDLADESCVHAVVGKRHSHIGLAAGIGRFKLICLHKAEIALRIEPHHDLTECNNSVFHLRSLLFASNSIYDFSRGLRNFFKFTSLDPFFVD